MADIVGLFASILQLVDTIAIARDYIKGFRDAPKDQQELLAEINNLAPLMKEVEERIKRAQSVRSGGGIQHFNEPLIQLDVVMRRLAKKLEPAGGVSRVSNRLTWPMWGKEDIQEGLRTIERFKSLLNAWLGIDILTSAQDIGSCLKDAAKEQRVDHGDIIRSLEDSARNQREYHDDVVAVVTDATEEQRIDHKYISKSVREVARNQQIYHDSLERSKVIEWCSPLNFFLRQADISNTRQPGTGLWLLDGDTFKEWESYSPDTENAQIEGDMLKESDSSDTEKAQMKGDIFKEAASDRSGTAKGRKALWCRGMPGAGKTVLVSMVVDTLRAKSASHNIGVAAIYLDHKETEVQSLPNLLAAVWHQLVVNKPFSSDVYQVYKKHREQHTRPSLPECSSMLRSAISEYSTVFIIVDGLDEYPQRQRDSLLLNLSALGLTVKLMFTSRTHVRIEHIIPTSDLEILEIRATGDDLRRFLDGQISMSYHLSNHIKKCPGLQGEIETSILRSSAGMFLLAKLHIDSLLTKHTVKAVREALVNLPGDLNSTYDEIMVRINQQNNEDSDLARRTLSWISNAKRVLHISELREALAVEAETTQLDPDNLLAADTILSVCAGLVTISDDDGLVRLNHHTTQGYLDRIQAREFPRASTEITATCLTYLSFEGFAPKLHDPASLSHENRLLDYAVEYCLIHARGSPESNIRDMILSFLGSCSVWQKLWNLRHPYQELPESSATLWISAIFGLEEICRYIIKEEGVGSVLQEAAIQGRIAVVRILVENGANVKADEGGYDNVLQAASVYGHEEIIRLLIDHGADVNSQGQNYGTALQSAAFFGQTQSVCLLLDAGADVNAEGGRYGTALYAATREDHYKVVCMLVERGADVNVGDKWGGTPLQVASSAGNEAIAKVLIENGADLKQMWNPSIRGTLRDKIVRLLIENGAEVRPDRADVIDEDC